MKMGATVQKLLEVKDKLTSTFKSGIGHRAAPDAALPQTATAQPSGTAAPAFPGPDADGPDGKGI